MHKRLFFFSILFISALWGITTIFNTPFASAQDSTVEDLKEKIIERNKIIADLDKEIAKYQGQLNETSKQAQTLQKALDTINQSINKLTAELSKTENNLVKTDYTIRQLGSEITEKEQTIEDRREALAALIRYRAEQEEVSLIEALLTYNSLSDAWNYLDGSWRLQKAINQNLEKIQGTKVKLLGDVATRESEKKKLQNYKTTLNDQKKIVEITKKDKSVVLAQTKTTESEQKKILAASLAKREAFLKELRQFEADLNLAIDPSKIPTAGKGVLGWPLASRTVTQLFGDTEFSRTHTQAYNGNGHNGIDIGVPIGTSLMSAADGVVLGTGDTDLVCRGASYGKWILIKHNNGLSTLYAHLSLIKVDAGQSVARGEVIGYTGNTGYSTGPHLHFTVYASDGVQIMSRKSVACGSTYTMPIADVKAYLNPMLYL